MCYVKFSADGKYLTTGCNCTAHISNTKTSQKFGEYFLFFFALLVFFFGRTSSLHLMTYTFTQYFFFSRTSVFWQTTLLENRTTCIGSVCFIPDGKYWTIIEAEDMQIRVRFSLPLAFVWSSINSLHKTSFFA